MVHAGLPALTTKGQSTGNALESLEDEQLQDCCQRCTTVQQRTEPQRSNLPTDTQLLYTLILIQTDLMHIVDNSSFIKQPSLLTTVPQKPALAVLLNA